MLDQSGVWKFARISMLAILLAVMIVSIANAQSKYKGMANEEPITSAKVTATCSSDSSSITPTGYFITLHFGDPNSIRDKFYSQLNSSGKTAPKDFIMASLAVFVKTNDGFLPVVPYNIKSNSLPSEYRIDCQPDAFYPHLNPSLYPTIKFVPRNKQNKTQLLEQLRNRVISVAQNKSIKPVLFSGTSVDDAVITWPSKGTPTLGQLIANYFNVRQEAGFIPGSHNVVVSSAALSVKFEVGRRFGSSEQAAPRILNLPDINAKKRSNIKIFFKEKGWGEIDLSISSHTFGQCEQIIPDGNNAYLLTGCLPNSQGAVPFKIAGFDLVFVPQEGGPLDTLLTVTPYRVPVPPDWADRDRRTLRFAGSLQDLLKTTFTIRQLGFKECSGELKLDILDIVSGRAKFPAPPCKLYSLLLPSELISQSSPPRILNGCVPGNVEVEVKPDGNAICLSAPKKGGQQTATTMSIKWAPGLRPFDVTVTPSAIDDGGSIKAEDVLGQLIPHYPFDEPESLFSIAPYDALPDYAPVEAWYIDTAGKPCNAQPFKIVSRRSPFIPVDQAGCTGIPSAVEVHFSIAENQRNSTLKTNVFKPNIRHTFQLADLDVAIGVLRPDDVVKKLRIAFSTSEQDRLLRQFVEPADLVLKGAQLFTDKSCSLLVVNGKYAFFDQVSDEAFTFPIYAQVRDSDGNTLSNCAEARLFAPQNGDTEYLTFDIENTRAIGARRAVVIANGTELSSIRGMAKALRISLEKLINEAHARHKQGAPLSPLNVFSVRNDTSLEQLFTGEQAALDPKRAKNSLRKIDRTAPRTIDLTVLPYQPEIKGYDALVVVMDGSVFGSRQFRELKLIAEELKAKSDKNRLFFALSSNSCSYWLPQAQNMNCAELQKMDFAQRVEHLLRIFSGLLNKSSGQE